MALSYVLLRWMKKNEKNPLIRSMIDDHAPAALDPRRQFIKHFIFIFLLCYYVLFALIFNLKPEKIN